MVQGYREGKDTQVWNISGEALWETGSLKKLEHWARWELWD